MSATPERPAQAAQAPLPCDMPRLRRTLRLWAERGWVRELDAAFADFLIEHAPDASAPLILAAALASHQLGRGHACLDLAATLADPALALSLPAVAAKPLILAATYAVVIFSIVVQGLTIKAVVRRTVG